ncbi:hypothetical protein AB595_14545 [Massilia sp. WF1]|uniref:hypothetical protein n=1 Tax=unclassified Massilia TaxID=2609279 RepID=UPI000649F93B|nr:MULTISPECIES: hypothetical protein [unclassified Massilia]ALK96224.1 hypothetical protein AM586_07970 [Massilia sp. WG5]KLU36197.1 hypothetical protein AB595_14545 [Massilia sp. WF1]
MSNASGLKNEIEAAIEDWEEEADAALGRTTLTKEQEIEQAEEIWRSHRQDIEDYLRRISRETADVNDDLSQEEKDEILAKVKDLLERYRH